MPIRKPFATAVRLLVLEVIVAFSCLTLACSGASFDVSPDNAVDDANTSSDVSTDSALLAVEVADDVRDSAVANDSMTLLDSASAKDSAIVVDSAPADTFVPKDTAPEAAVDATPTGEACELLPTKDAPHCAMGQSCDLDAKGKPYCRTADLTAAPGKCALNEECNANETCFYAAGATSGTCMLFCRSDADCCVGGPCSGSYSCKKSPILYTSSVTGASYGVCRS